MKTEILKEERNDDNAKGERRIQLKERKLEAMDALNKLAIGYHIEPVDYEKVLANINNYYNSKIKDLN